MSVLAVSACGSDDSSSGPASYRWSGTVWGSTDDNEAVACFGPTLASNPPAGCSGWPLAGFDWSTAPAVEDYRLPHVDTPIRPIRTAYVTIVGHPEGTSFMLDGPPALVDPTGPAAPECHDLMGAEGPAVSMRQVQELLAVGQREGQVLPTSPDGGGSDLVAADFAHPDPLLMTLLVDDAPTRKWIVEHLTGIRIHLCGLLHPA